jgi:Ca2+/Na+ antiporter
MEGVQNQLERIEKKYEHYKSRRNARHKRQIIYLVVAVFFVIIGLLVSIYASPPYKVYGNWVVALTIYAIFFVWYLSKKEPIEEDIFASLYESLKCFEEYHEDSNKDHLKRIRGKLKQAIIRSRIGYAARGGNRYSKTYIEEIIRPFNRLATILRKIRLLIMQGDKESLTKAQSKIQELMFLFATSFTADSLKSKIEEVDRDLPELKQKSLTDSLASFWRNEYVRFSVSLILGFAAVATIQYIWTSVITPETTILGGIALAALLYAAIRGQGSKTLPN